MYHYFQWTFYNSSGATGGTTTVAGFYDQFETYQPPYSVTICDRVMCVTPTPYVGPTPTAYADNPIAVPPGCGYETENNATCNVNIGDDADL